MRVLAVNPGSTSTKIAVFDDERCVFRKSLEHTPDELARFSCNNDQLGYREQMVVDALAEHALTPSDMDAFAGRGGGQCSHVGGTYRVNELMVREAHDEVYASHPALLGCQIVFDLERRYGAPSYMVNSPATDEMRQVARVTGMRGVYRICYSHALNQKEVAQRYAASVGRTYEGLNLVVCHIGGGVSVTAHERGRMVDTNDILNGDGPMAPTRVGSIPAVDVARKTAEMGDLKATERYLRSQGGLLDLLGTYDVREVRARIDAGDVYAKNVYDAMIYQIAKYVGSMAAAMRYEVDAVVLTGGHRA